MRPLMLLALVVLVALTASVPSAEIKDGPLKAGENVPGAFHPYNVTARVPSPEEAEQADQDAVEKTKEKDKYTPVGKFHCLVTEYDLDPVVILFANGLDDSAGFKELVKKLEASIKKNRVRRLRAFVVFLDKDLKAADKEDLVQKDDKRSAMVEAAEKFAKGFETPLESVVLTLASYKDVAKYELKDTTALTAVLYKNLRVVKGFTFESSDLENADSPAVAEVVAGAEEMIKPK